MKTLGPIGPRAVGERVKWVKVMLLYKVGGGLHVVGGGGSVVTHTAGSVTTQSIAFKYVMAFKPYRTT